MEILWRFGWQKSGRNWTVVLGKWRVLLRRVQKWYPTWKRDLHLARWRCLWRRRGKRKDEWNGSRVQHQKKLAIQRSVQRWQLSWKWNLPLWRWNLLHWRIWKKQTSWIWITQLSWWAKGHQMWSLGKWWIEETILNKIGQFWQLQIDWLIKYW